VDLVIPLDSPEAEAAESVGPKASRLAALDRAGTPVADGFCLAAAAYRAHLAAAGLAETARRAAATDGSDGRRLALDVKLGLLEAPLDPSLREALVAAWRRLAGDPPAPVAVRSSALLEDRAGATFAGQFDTFLGIDGEADFLTAVRACWASLWATRARRYMQARDVDPASTAMAVLVQRLVPARASGGALSLTPEGRVALTGAWGLGSAIAQGEVVPDRFLLERDGTLVAVEPGRKDRLVTWSPERGPHPRAVSRALVEAPCLDDGQAVELGRIVLAVEAVIGAPVEVEWALGEGGFTILQARPLSVEPPSVPDGLWLRHPSLTGQPAGVGRGTGPARIVLHEHDLERVEAGEVLVIQIAGPALTAVLHRVAGVVAELGGSTSHLAALARERGIPAVLGVRDATRRIPSGSLVAVDGVTGVVRWTR
jgi:pyruvate,water dikinase